MSVNEVDFREIVDKMMDSIGAARNGGLKF